MQKLVELKARMKSIEGIRTVTQIMATVSAAKLSKTRRAAEGARVYATELRRMILVQQAYAKSLGVDLTGLSPFLAPHPQVERILLIHLASDMGMCGSYNLQINRAGAGFVREQVGLGREVSVWLRGGRGERAIASAGGRLWRSEVWGHKTITRSHAHHVTKELKDMYLAGEFQEIHCAFSRFHSPIYREPTVLRLLPLALGEAEVALDETVAWIHQPSLPHLAREIVRLYLEAQVMDCLLEAYTSEHGARMIAMEEAVERAGKNLQECRIAYHRLRRESITEDLIGILCSREVMAPEVGWRN